MFNTVKEVLADVLTKGSKRLLATYLQTLLAYPDGCTRSETVFDPVKGDILVQVPPLAEQRAIVVLLDGADPLYDDPYFLLRCVLATCNVSGPSDHLPGVLVGLIVASTDFLHPGSFHFRESTLLPEPGQSP